MSNYLQEKFFLKKPVKFEDICKIYPPTINEILENEDFQIYRSLFTISQEQIEDKVYDFKNMYTLDDRVIPTPYEYFTENMDHPQKRKLVLEGFEFFIHEKVLYMDEQNCFMIGDLEDTLMSLEDLDSLKFINEDNYFDFQNLIRQSVGEDPLPPYKKEPDKIRKMKAKARYRDSIKNKQDEKKGITLLTNIAAICCMEIGLTPLNIGEISYAAVQPLMKIYQQKERYDIDIKSLIAGADPKKVKPKYWIS